MDSSFVKEKKQREVIFTWRTPQCKTHPHQLWLTAADTNKVANFNAYRTACRDLSDEECEQVFALHDSAQHHFITMLLWSRPGQGYMSIEEALQQARAHHSEVSQYA